MKIADLARASGTPRSAIHHYRNLGLLPPARVLGPKLHVYGDEHVARLREIAKLRAERGLSLHELRRRFEQRAARPHAPPRPARRPARETDASVREKLIDVATRRFTEDGFDAANVNAIAREAGIGKATLYRYFRSKTALFVECIDRLRLAVVSAEERLTVAAGSRISFDDQLRLRAMAVLARFGPFRMMTNLLTAAAYGKDAAVARLAREALHRMITNVEPSLRAAMATGAIRTADSELLAYMAWGALMAVGDRVTADDRYTLGEAVAIYHDTITRTLRPDPPASA